MLKFLASLYVKSPWPVTMLVGAVAGVALLVGYILLLAGVIAIGDLLIGVMPVCKIIGKLVGVAFLGALLLAACFLMGDGLKDKANEYLWWHGRK